MLSSLKARDIAKFTAMAATSIATKTALVATIDATTDIETDTFPVDLGTTVAGAVVAVKLSPVTDAGVDRVADWRLARKNAKIAKKLATES